MRARRRRSALSFKIPLESLSSNVSDTSSMISSCRGASLYCRVSDAGCSGIKPALSIVKPGTPRDVRCMARAEITWSAVCSVALHWKFDEGARPHLYMDE